MSLKVRKKWLKNVLMVYLILAMIGLVALSYEQTNKNILGSSVYFSSIAPTIDCLAEDMPIFSKAYNYSNSPLRNSLVRVFFQTGIIGIVMFLAKSNFKINKSNNFPTIKNIVPLKLRI